MNNEKITAIQNERQLKSNNEIVKDVIAVLVKNNLSVKQAREILRVHLGNQVIRKSLQRNTGKTTELVKLSAQKQIPILCMDTSISHINDIAKDLNLNIPTPISINNYRQGETDTVLVDNAEYVLQYLLGCNIDTLSMSNNW